MTIQTELAPLAWRSTGPDTDKSTAETVGLMLQYSDAAQSQEPIIQATREALRGVPADAPAWHKANAIHRWITRHIQFVPDEQMLQELGYPQDWELLISPYLLLTWRKGDCDCFAMLTRAMLLCAGIPASILTIAADPSTPWRWSHVYAVAYTEDGSRLPCDTAAAVQMPGLGLGWSAPNVFRSKEWVS